MRVTDYPLISCDCGSLWGLIVFDLLFSLPDAEGPEMVGTFQKFLNIVGPSPPLPAP